MPSRLPPFVASAFHRDTPNSAQPVTANVNDPSPAERVPDPLDPLKSRARVGGVSSQNTPVRRRFEAPSLPPMPKLDVSDHARTPQANAQAPERTGGLMAATTAKFEKMMRLSRTRSTDAVVEMHPLAAAASVVAGGAAAPRRGDRVSVADAMHGLFAPSPHRSVAVARWMSLAGDDDAQLGRLMAHAVPVATLCAGDPARLMAVMDALDPATAQALDALPAQTRSDMHAVQTKLALTGLGMKTLMELTGHRPAGAEIALAEYQHRDAVKIELRAGQQLASLLPAGVRSRIQSREDVAALARIALGEPEDPAAPEHTRQFLLALGPRDRGVLVNRGGQFALALLCGRALGADIDADPPLQQKSAYFAFRNGLLDSADERVPDLRHFKEALFGGFVGGLSDALAGVGTAERMVSRRATPVDAFDLGSAAARLRNIHEDFAHVEAATDQLVSDLNAQVAVARGTLGASDAVLRKAVRAETIAAYKRKVGQDGWFDSVKVSKQMRNEIAQNAAAVLGVSRKEVLRRDHTIGDLPLTPALLRQWAAEEGLDLSAADPTGLGAKLERLERLQNRGDRVPVERTPQALSALFRSLIEETRHTFAVNYASGGRQGVHVNIGIAEPLQRKIDKYLAGLMPIVIPIPDARVTDGRSKLLTIGSTGAGSGILSMGEEHRKQFHLGVGALASVPVVPWVTGSAGGSVIPFAHESAQGQGVTLRTRLFPVGGPPPGLGELEPWRARMLDLFDAMIVGGHDGGIPQRPNELWNALVSEAYKDPNVSINWTQTKSNKTSSSFSFIGGIRAGARQVKIGPMGTPGANRVWSNKTRREDVSGALKVHNVIKSSLLEGTISGGVSVAAQPAGPLMDTGAAQFPAVPLAGRGTTFGNTYKGVTKRICEDDDGLVADATLSDQEFGSVHEYLKYADSRDASWVWSASRDADPQAGTPAVDGRTALDEFNSRMKSDAKAGNQLFIERLSLRKPAAQAYSQLDELSQRLPASTNADFENYRRVAISSALLPLGTASSQRDFQDEQNAMSHVLDQVSNWRNRFLYAVDDVRISVADGNSTLLVAESINEVAHMHMTHVLPARPDDPPQAREPVG